MTLFLDGSRSPRIYLSKSSQMMCFFLNLEFWHILTAIHSISFTMAFRSQPTRPSWSQHLHEAQGSSIRRREMCDIQHLSVATSAEVVQLREEMSREHQNWKKDLKLKAYTDFHTLPLFLKLQKWLPVIQEPASVLEGRPLSPWEDAIWDVICSWPWNA